MTEVALGIKWQKCSWECKRNRYKHLRRQEEQASHADNEIQWSFSSIRETEKHL
jgi:hypothetical protein